MPGVPPHQCWQRELSVTMGIFHAGCLIRSEATHPANVVRVTEGWAFITSFDVDGLKR